MAINIGARLAALLGLLSARARSAQICALLSTQAELAKRTDSPASELARGPHKLARGH